MSDVSNFTCLKPLPESHPRVIAIHGTIPGNSDPRYEEFEKLLWTLTELESDARETPITLVIDSSGGNAAALNMLLVHIGLISSPVYMVARNTGSAASILLANGERGHRYVFENSSVALHNPFVRDEQSECPGHRHLIFFKRYCEPSAEMAMRQTECSELTWRFARTMDECTDEKLLVSDEKDEEKRAAAMIRMLDEAPVFNGREAVQRGLADQVIGEEEFKSLFLR